VRDAVSWPGVGWGAAAGLAGIRKNRNGTRYQVWWRLDDGTQGSKTFDSRGLARDFKNELLAQAAANAWVDPRRGRILFDDWADHWWRLWSSSPRRSPKGMETTDSHLRCHLRPSFGRRQLQQITPSSVLRWQHELEAKLSHSGVMACRSILLRVLEAARKERLIATNPVREVEGPSRAWTLNRSSAISADGPSRPRSSATFWPAVGPSTVTTS
jgi:hypothetical protein